MPTVVSYLHNNAFRPIDARQPGEGEVFNLNTEEWEEPDVLEKGMLLGYARNETASPHVTKADRSIRLARSLNANVMRWMEALLAAPQT